MTRTFDPAVYWKLRAFTSDTRLCATAIANAQEAFATANRKQMALLKELDIDPNAANVSLNDDTFTLTIPDPQGET